MDMNSWSNSQQLQDRIIWVRSQAEAEAYPMVPNATMQFWDIYQPVIYRKMTDAYGRTSLFEVYDLKLRETKPTVQQQQYSTGTPQPSVNDYVHVDAFNNLVSQVEQMNVRMANFMDDFTKRVQNPAPQNMAPPPQSQNQQQNHQDRRKDGNR